MRKIKIYISVLLIITIVSSVGLVILGSFDKDFDFDIVNGSDHPNGYSSTKEEAIHRKTYICDVAFPSNPYSLSKKHTIYVQSGWVEHSWRGGFWYWTTTKDTGNDAYYNIVLICKKSKNDTTDLVILNNQKSLLTGYVQLQDIKGRITGSISSLPISDTLRYTVLKRDTVDFDAVNIEGILPIILKRKH